MLPPTSLAKFLPNPGRVLIQCSQVEAVSVRNLLFEENDDALSQTGMRLLILPQFRGRRERA